MVIDTETYNEIYTALQSAKSSVTIASKSVNALPAKSTGKRACGETGSAVVDNQQ